MDLRTWIHFGVLCLSVVLFPACKRSVSCPPPSSKYFPINEDERALFAYEPKDTIKFIVTGPQSFSLAFYGQKKDSSYWKTGAYAGYDCPSDQWQYREKQSVEFRSPNYTTALVYEQYVPGYFEGNSEIGVTFKKINFITTGINYIRIDPPPGYYDADSIEIQGKVYYNVRLVHEDRDVTKTANLMLYNREYGILKMTFANGEVWERIP